PGRDGEADRAVGARVDAGVGWHDGASYSTVSVTATKSMLNVGRMTALTIARPAISSCRVAVTERSKLIRASSATIEPRKPLIAPVIALRTRALFSFPMNGEHVFRIPAFA